MKMVKARISLEDMRALVFPIIPYQVITGNYDKRCKELRVSNIIPYQVITGNYDKPVSNQDGIIHLSYTIYVVG